ncbi:MAG: TetR/AcrR family transcriptional regulator [Deltaproteobacteria bacterium]|nr:TetR/AcrR family transcriptional regulator [Deltaproteobacteria bacterium]
MRARLLDSAAQHFAAHGFGGANINRISIDAGCAKGTVYNYFPSKEALFAAVLGVGSDETVRRYRARAPAADLREQLIVLTREDVALVRKHEAFMKVIVREGLVGNPATRKPIEAGLAPLIGLLVELMGPAQARGELRADLPLPQLVTTFGLQMTMLYAEHWRSGGRWPTWKQLPEVLVGMFLDGAAHR